MVKRGELWLAALDPAVGSEIRKSRPCLVVSTPEMHEHLTNGGHPANDDRKPPCPYRVPVFFENTSGLILVDQVRTVDKQRLVKRLGVVPARVLSEALRVLQETFAE